ncbi:MAG TPA: hypothetical protein VN673_15600 [Clostridia bacterium]|nr:hypothetical protein [Clostridia bacterium]
MKSPESELTALCETRLREFTAADSADLSEFAECRLIVNGISPTNGEDVSQRALQLVLQGLESDRGGRRPRLVDLTDKSAFLNYLRGIISSLVYGMTRKSGFGADCTLDEDHEEQADFVHDHGAAAKALEWNDLRDQMFPRLRARAAVRLLPTIDAWEKVFTESDRIPAPVRREHVREVKDLARKVLTELDGLH